MITLKDVQKAAQTISGKIRRTPLIEATHAKTTLHPSAQIFLKLDTLQVTGAFKVRGAVNKISKLTPEQLQHGIITASGGNHGVAVAYAAYCLGAKATIYFPKTVSENKLDRVKTWGAETVVFGDNIDQALKEASAQAESKNMTYVHPFADPHIIAGQGTLALEILEDQPDIDTIIVAIGGGGLSSGVATAAKAINPKIKIIGVEPVGAPTLYESRKAGHVIQLDQVKTEALTMAISTTSDINFEIIERLVDDIVLVSDEEMYAASKWLWDEYAVPTELSGAAAVAAILSNKVSIGKKVCPIVCGAGTAFMPQ